MLFKIFLNEKGNPKNIYKKLLAFKRIKNSKFFDKKYYTKISNIDKSEIDPLYHYMYFGYKEGNNPSKNFDNEYYIKKYPDVKRSGMNPLEHYVLYGQKENRFINETVDLENIFRIAKENTIKYEALKEEYTKIESCNKEFHELFNILFVHMNFETKGTLKIFQEIWVLFLDLINKICKKHSIKFWLDYGVLLGAIRHEDFIPWDYDLDIGMMRNDYNKFLTAIKKEIKDNNLENLILLNRSSYTGFLKVQSPMFDPAYFCATVDVFPYDYTKEEDMKLLTIKYEKIQTDLINFYQENNDNNCGSFLVGLNSNKEDSFHKEIQEVSKKKLKILISESENIIPGIDSLPTSIYPLRMIKKRDIFPLKIANIKNKKFPVPSNSQKYLSQLYGSKYMEIPKSLPIYRSHYFRLFNIDSSSENDMNEILMVYYNELKKANENFN